MSVLFVHVVFVGMFWVDFLCFLFKSFAANDHDGPVGVATVSAIFEGSLCSCCNFWHALGGLFTGWGVELGNNAPYLVELFGKF